MGADKSKSFAAELAHYKVLEQLPELGHTHLAHIHTDKEYLLRELTFNDQAIYAKALDDHKKRHALYAKQGGEFEHLTRLHRVEGQSIDHLCSNLYKVYALWEFPCRRLKEELAERTSSNGHAFEERELWSILASSILAMSTIQKAKVRH